MKKQAEEMQSQLANEFFVGSSKNGKISITINGNQEIVKIFVSEDNLHKSDIENGVMEAHKDARKKSEAVLKQKLMGMM